MLRGVQSGSARPIGAMLRAATWVAVCGCGAAGWALGVGEAEARARCLLTGP